MVSRNIVIHLAHRRAVLFVENDLMQYQTCIPVALKIYEMGINCLLDVRWTRTLFSHTIQDDLLSGKCPRKLFEKTLPNGLLNYMGGIFFDMLFNVKDDAAFIDDVHEIRDKIDFLSLMFYASDLAFVENESPFRNSLVNLVLVYDEIEDILKTLSRDKATNEFRAKHLDAMVYDVVSEVEDLYQEEIKILRNLYAASFAERVFHDREFCEYISYLAVTAYRKTGFPVLGTKGVHWSPQIQREKFPSWVMTTLRARERDKCAQCGKSISELQGEFHIDHIVPLSKFGFNDIANLQLLCQDCNLAKTSNLERTSSSIPNYFTWRKSLLQLHKIDSKR